jgi:hypothetical protein
MTVFSPTGFFRYRNNTNRCLGTTRCRCPPMPLPESLWSLHWVSWRKIFVKYSWMSLCHVSRHKVNLHVELHGAERTDDVKWISVFIARNSTILAYPYKRISKKQFKIRVKSGFVPCKKTRKKISDYYPLKYLGMQINHTNQRNIPAILTELSLFLFLHRNRSGLFTECTVNSICVSIYYGRRTTA